MLPKQVTKKHYVNVPIDSQSHWVDWILLVLTTSSSFKTF